MNSSWITTFIWCQRPTQSEKKTWAHPLPTVQISGYTYHMSTTQIQLSNLLIMNILRNEDKLSPEDWRDAPGRWYRINPHAMKIKIPRFGLSGTWKLNPRAVVDVHHSSDCAIILKNCLHQSVASTSNLRSSNVFLRVCHLTPLLGPTAPRNNARISCALIDRASCCPNYIVQTQSMGKVVHQPAVRVEKEIFCWG